MSFVTSLNQPRTVGENPLPIFTRRIARARSRIVFEKENAMARVNPIPEGCHSVQPYMMFSECAKAMEFYTKAFGAREVFRFQGEDGQVHHAEMQIGDSRIMMADESPKMDAYGTKHYGGS